MKDMSFLAKKLDEYLGSNEFWGRFYFLIYEFLVGVLISEKRYTKQHAEQVMSVWLKRKLEGKELQTFKYHGRKLH